MWRNLTIAVLVPLLLAMLIAEYYAWTNPQLESLKLHFGFALILGLLGGALSAYVRARDAVIRIPDYQLVGIHTSMRMVMGAAGAFVIVLSTQAVTGDIPALIRSNPLVFMLVAIAGGFSERLFIDSTRCSCLECLQATGNYRSRWLHECERRRSRVGNRL